MAFERLPGRQLQLPTEGSVAVKPVPYVYPTAAIVQQAINGILKTIDPVERAKNKALIAYYNELAANGGMKAMTPQQLATYQNTLLHNKALIDAQGKYKLPDEYFSAPSVPVKTAPQIVTPQQQDPTSLGGVADPGRFILGKPLSFNTDTTSGVGNELANGDLSTIPSSPNSYAMTGDIQDLDAVTAQLKQQHPDKSDREIQLLAQSMIGG